MKARFLEAAAWLWQRSAAAIALVAILLAFWIGYEFRTPIEVTTHEDEAVPKEYTCSMHPTVRSTDPNAKCPICHMDLVELTPELAAGGPRRLALSEAARRGAAIETVAVPRFFPEADVRLFGRVTYDETSVARLTAYFPGRVDRLFVNYVGVPVAKGDHLAEVYSPDLIAAFEELRQFYKSAHQPGAPAIVSRSAHDDWFAARDKLRLYGVSDEQVQAIETGSFHGDHLTIYSPIGGVVTKLATREGDYLETGQPIAMVADLSHLWLDLEAYESQLPLLRWGQLVEFRVAAQPGRRFTGRVAFIEPMVDLSTRTAAVRVAVDNSDHRLKAGMFASASVRPRIAADGVVLGDELAGRWVSPMHPTIVRDGPGSCDICGMALVPAESLGVVGDPAAAKEPLVVPRSALLFTGRRSVVYVRIPNAPTPTYEGREVDLGPRAGEFYTVREGLAEGEQVVVHGAFRVDSAMQLAAKPSMMLREHAPNSATHPMTVPDAFVFSLKPVYASYLSAQEALAADDLAAFTQALSDLRVAVAGVDATSLAAPHRATWQRLASRLRGDDGDAASLDDARVRFDALSVATIELHSAFGHFGSQSWHVSFCPMAFHGRGAKWVQRGDEIHNPYFGSTMLDCGEIRQTLAPKEKP